MSNIIPQNYAKSNALDESVLKMGMYIKNGALGAEFEKVLSRWKIFF